MALTSTGRVLAWGNNAFGQLGDGTTTTRHAPVRVKIPRGVTVTAISAGYNSGLALTKSGRVLAWGGNTAGQLGNGTEKARLKPVYVRLPGHTKIASIAAGYLTGYAVTSTGRLLAWGYNVTGELGDGTTTTRLTPVPVRLPHGVTVVSATAGMGHALALTAGGRVLAWGSNMFGQLGNGSTTDRHVPVLVQLPKGSRARALAGGQDFSMALTTADRVLTWGANGAGQLGNGTTKDSATPVRVHLPRGFKTTGIGAGWNAETGLAIGNAPLALTRRAATDSAATDTAATNHAAAAPGGVAPLRAWGLGNFGQLGNGTLTSAAAIPVRVRLPRGVTVRQVRAGCFHSVALASTGRVYAWGDNSVGQLGDGTSVPRNTPVQVKLPAGVKVTAVRAGCRDSLALTSTGRVYAWGGNFFGQLGDGTHLDRHRPVLVRLPGSTRIKAISSGCYHGMALTAAGHVLAWGYNDYGQLGNGSTTSSDVPVQVALPRGATPTIVAAGCNHSIAMTSSGLYAWGLNLDGELGDGTRTDSSVPVLILILRTGPPLGRLVSLFGGCSHSLALFASGTVLAWGYNADGELGNGSMSTSLRPVGVAVPASVRVKAISASCDASYALTTSGKVLAWGLNDHGQLGNGDLISRSLPTVVHLPGGLAATAVSAGPGVADAFALVRRK